MTQIPGPEAPSMATATRGVGYWSDSKRHMDAPGELGNWVWGVITGEEKTRGGELNVPAVRAARRHWLPSWKQSVATAESE